MHPSVDDTLDFVDVRGGGAMQYWIAVVESGTDDWAGHRSCGFLVDAFAYMSQCSDVEVGCLADAVDVGVEGKSPINGVAQALDRVRHSDWGTANCHRIDSTLLSGSSTSTDNDRFRIVRVESKTVLCEPPVHGLKSAVERFRGVFLKFDV